MLQPTSVRFRAQAALLTVDAYASQPNYWRHLAPLVHELHARGHTVCTWTAEKERPWGVSLKKRRQRGAVALCAAGIDAKRLAPQRTIYVEHGAGQTYVGQDGYAGMTGLGHVVLFLGPGEHVAQRWRDAYPQAAVESVGCPALDRHLPSGRACDSASKDVRHRRPLVAITSHWRCGRLNETMPALHEYERGISELARLEEIQLLGHAHPRLHMKGAKRWADLGVEFDPDPDSVLRRADLLVADNTSLLYEAAALDIPVLVLNGSLYRRDVEHGLRFWSHVPGLQCDNDSAFVHAAITALGDPYPAQLLRQRAAWHVYAHRDGSSTRRAVDAIERVLDG